MMAVGFLLWIGVCPAVAATGTISPSPYQTVLGSNGLPVSGACIWTYLAGTTTATPTYTDVTLTVANTNPIVADSAGRYVAWLSPGASYKFQLENTPCSVSPPTHGSIIRTADNISAVPAASSTLDTIGTAGVTLSSGMAVYLSDGSGSLTPGQWYLADVAQTYSSTTPWIGITTATISTGQTGTIRLAGSLTGLSSLTVGGKYYVGSAGALTTTPATNVRLLGQADTATSLIVTANPPSDATPWQDFSASSTITGWTSFTTKSIYYKRVGSSVYMAINLQGTSNATSVSFTLPFTMNATNPLINIPFVTLDNGAAVTGMCQLAAGSSTMNCFTTYAAGTWTASGSKQVYGEFFYQQ